MFTFNSLALLILGLSMLSLVGLHFALAIGHDRAVTAAAPLRTLDEIVGQIDSKRAVLSDLETELAKRREALVHLADIQSDVDAMSRKLDELNAEWLQLDERRKEVRIVREEMEASLAEKATLDGELAAARADLDAVQDRLASAERLFSQIDVMKKEHAELEGKIARMRDEAVALEDAEKRLEILTSQALQRERELAQLDGQTAAARAELDLARDQQASERATIVEIKAELTQCSAELAASAERQRTFLHENERLEDRRSQLQAQVARLEEQAGDTSAPTIDAIDEKLKELKAPPPVLDQMKSWRERAGENESEAIKRVKERLVQSGLDYHPRTVDAFHTAMKVNETAQMAVLAGISGTGKSQLPRQYALGMGIGFLQVPVQPRWDSPQDLMGFYNYIEKRFRPTDMARALYQLDHLNNPNPDFEDRMLMILLDEMNLARVEYYFSDFLSRLESRPLADRVADMALRKDAEIELEIPMPKGMAAPRVFPGYNLLFAGTMNEDESTQSLSDKVVDRANVLRFAAPKSIKTRIGAGPVHLPEALSEKRWRSWVRPVTTVEGEGIVGASIEKMVDLMSRFKRPIGHRLGRAIVSYVANYPVGPQGRDLRIPLADQVEMRLLPKLRGVEVDNASFGELRDFVARDLQDEILAQAIDESIRSAEDASGQFVWTGVTR
jgi:predicted nuclease with TOPRIM domain